MGRKKERPRESPRPAVRARPSCQSGKVQIVHERYLTGVAASAARGKNEKGELAPDFYAYRCPECRDWHLTKDAIGPRGERNLLVHRAASEELQRWAMPPGTNTLR